MPRPRKEQLNEQTRHEIKQIARALMKENGTAGLSLRAIAREMKITAPALYHYYPSLDDLITALLVDAFTQHAFYVRDHILQAQANGLGVREQLFVGMLAYREWALNHAVDYQLVYGNPIPGYVAPKEVTVPAAKLMSEIFLSVMNAGVASGELQLSSFHQRVPPSIAGHFREAFFPNADETAIAVFYVMNCMWSIMHGLVALELTHHTPPVVGDSETFYRAQIQNQLDFMEYS